MRLLHFLNDSVNDKAILKCVFVSGSPGAGKSYVLTKVGFGSVAPRIINTDKWTEWFGHGANVDWDAYGDKITKLTSKNVFDYINGLLPLFIDSTSANFTNTVNRKMLLDWVGYDTGCVFINTSLETSIRRNNQRQRKVPEEFLVKTYNKVQTVKKRYAQWFKFYKEIDNNDGELTDEVILKAFKAVSGFFSQPVQNPKGQQVIEELQTSKKKYLTELPQFSDLQARIDADWWK